MYFIGDRDEFLFYAFSDEIHESSPDVNGCSSRQRTVDKGAEFAGIDEAGVLAAGAGAAFSGGSFIFRNKLRADGNLHAVEQPAWENDHAVHEVGPDEGSADFAVTGLVGRHTAIGEDKAGHALRGDVVNEALHPG